MNQQVTGKPSIDKPWMKYYPPQLIQGLTIPAQTVYEYLMERCPEDDVVAIHYYGRDIRWRELKEQVDLAARSLRAIGFVEGDQIPIFLRAVPEFIYLLLAAEKIGASVLCRDNTLEENIEAVKKSGAKMIIAHDFLSHEELNRYRKEAGIRGAVLLSPIRSSHENGASGLLLELSGISLYRLSGIRSVHDVLGGFYGNRGSVYRESGGTERH